MKQELSRQRVSRSLAFLITAAVLVTSGCSATVAGKQENSDSKAHGVSVAECTPQDTLDSLAFPDFLNRIGSRQLADGSVNYTVEISLNGGPPARGTGTFQVSNAGTNSVFDIPDAKFFVEVLNSDAYVGSLPPTASPTFEKRSISSITTSEDLRSYESIVVIVSYWLTHPETLSPAFSRVNPTAAAPQSNEPLASTTLVGTSLDEAYAAIKSRFNIDAKASRGVASTSPKLTLELAPDCRIVHATVEIEAPAISKTLLVKYNFNNWSNGSQISAPSPLGSAPATPLTNN